MKKNPFIFVLLLFLLTYCTEKQDATPDLNNPATGVQAVNGDPSLNRFILTSHEEELIRVDPNDGTHEVLFTFPEDVDVTSVRYTDPIMYVGAKNNAIHAIDINSKDLLWDIPLMDYDDLISPDVESVVKDGMCYAVGEWGTIVAADALTGDVLWTYVMSPYGPTDDYYDVNWITVTDDNVIAGSTETIFYDEEDRDYVHLIEKATGERIWRKELPAERWVSGAIKQAGDILLVPANNLYALDMATGDVLWEFDMPELSRGAGTPSVAGDKVLLQGGTEGNILGGALFCLDLQTGQELWEIEAGGDVAGAYSALVIDDVVFGVYERGSALSLLGNGRPFLADIATGQVLWENDDISVETNPVYANGRLYFHGQHFAGEGSTFDNVGLMCMEAATGKFLWVNNYFQYTVSTPIVIADNGVFGTATHQ